MFGGISWGDRPPTPGIVGHDKCLTFNGDGVDPVEPINQSRAMVLMLFLTNIYKAVKPGDNLYTLDLQGSILSKDPEVLFGTKDDPKSVSKPGLQMTTGQLCG